MRSLRDVLHRIRSERSPFRFLLSRALRASRLSPIFFIKKEGFRLRFYPTALSASLWVDPNCRRDDERFLKAYLRPGDIAIDVGANIGSLTLCAASLVGSNGHVYAIEPHPRSFRYLERNVRLNAFGNITLFRTALGDRSQTAFIGDRYSDDQNTMSAAGFGIQVEMTTLDALGIQDRHPRIQLLKIDVEGFEKFVLLGAKKLLAKTDVIYLESIEELYRRFGYGFSDISDLLTSEGFEILRVNEAEGFAPVEAAGSRTLDENRIAVKDVTRFKEEWARRTLNVASRKHSLTSHDGRH